MDKMFAINFLDPVQGSPTGEIECISRIYNLKVMLFLVLLTHSSFDIDCTSVGIPSCVRATEATSHNGCGGGVGGVAS